MTPEKALGGVKVLEFASVISGPFCAKLLADLGAEVIKIEQPRVGDETRRRGPFLNDAPHPERSGLFLYLNNSKLGITLDPKTATGKELFVELVKDADILVEDKPPGTMKELALDYGSLKVVNERLVMTSITPFGQTGRYRNFKALDLNIAHGGGEGYLLPSGLSFALYPDRPPLRGGWYLADYQAGVTAAVGTLGALFATRQFGLGQHVDISKQETQLNLNRADILGYVETGSVPHRAVRGTRRAFAYGGCLRCKDGYVEIVAIEEAQWQGLVKLMDNPEWARDERFKDIFSRAQNGEELNQLIGSWMIRHTKEEVHRRAREMGCTVEVVFEPEDIVKSEQEKARGFFVEVDRSDTGKLLQPSWGYLLSSTPASVMRPAPLLGQHNEEVYCHRLGYDRQALVKMAEAGTI